MIQAETMRQSAIAHLAQPQMRPLMDQLVQLNALLHSSTDDDWLPTD